MFDWIAFNLDISPLKVYIKVTLRLLFLSFPLKRIKKTMSYSTILTETRTMVSEYMSAFDPSHDMYHVDRVTRLGTYHDASILHIFMICSFYFVTAQ